MYAVAPIAGFTIMKRLGNNAGFTMIEAVAVMALVGVMTAAVISFAPTNDHYALFVETEALKSHLRHAQMRAMSALDSTTWGVDVAAGSYTLLTDDEPASMSLPGEASAAHAFQNGVAAVPVKITFTEWGDPGDATQTVTLSKGGQTQTITVTRNTGFIP